MKAGLGQQPASEGVSSVVYEPAGKKIRSPLGSIAGMRIGEHPTATTAHSATTHKRAHASWHRRFIVERLSEGISAAIVSVKRTTRLGNMWRFVTMRCCRKTTRAGRL